MIVRRSNIVVVTHDYHVASKWLRSKGLEGKHPIIDNPAAMMGLSPDALIIALYPLLDNILKDRIAQHVKLGGKSRIEWVTDDRDDRDMNLKGSARTRSIVENIERDLRRGLTKKYISEKHGISLDIVRKIERGEHWVQK